MMFKDRRHDLLKIRSRIHRHQKNLSRYCKDVQTTHKANIIRRNLQGKNHSQNIRQKTKKKQKKHQTNNRKKRQKEKKTIKKKDNLDKKICLKLTQ